MLYACTKRSDGTSALDVSVFSTNEMFLSEQSWC